MLKATAKTLLAIRYLQLNDARTVLAHVGALLDAHELDGHLVVDKASNTDTSKPSALTDASEPTISEIMV